MTRLLRLRAADSFQAKLTVTTTAGILAMVVASSLLASGVVGEQQRTRAVKNALRLTAQFGEQSLIALLTENVGNVALAEQRVASIKLIPDVHYAAILKPDFSPLATAGKPVSWTPASVSGVTFSAAALAAEDDQFWYLVAPVETKPTLTPLGAGVGSQQLGYVYLTWDKRSVKETQRLIVSSIVLVSLTIASVLLAWLWRSNRRLTTPLNELAAVMRQAHRDLAAAGVRANVAGTRETREIADAFNRLMAKLEQQQAALRSEVHYRTSELHVARDAALTADQHKSEFQEAVTHEMRTPLNNILCYAQTALEDLIFVEEDADAGSLHRCLEVIFASASHLLYLVDQVLDLARIEAGRMEVHRQPTQLDALIQQVIADLKPKADDQGNQLHVIVEGPLDVVIDSGKLYSILRNLLDNACKFTENGVITLHAVGTATSLVVDVADTGIGIPRDQQAVIFERFRQLDMSTTRRYPGTGLGLAITKRFCDLLGGSITVDSREGEGSRFSVIIPLPHQERLSTVTLTP